jgi:hypothetical protein
MPRLLTSLPVLASMIAASAVVVYGCSSNASNPGNPDFTGGAGGVNSSGGSGGIGLGGIGAAAGSGGGIVCTNPTDTDKDGIADQLEGRNFEGGPSVDTNGNGVPDYKDLDSDGDGIPDSVEAVNPYLPVGTPGQSRSNTCSPVADTDGDGIPDFQDLDSDNDGVPDKDEKVCAPDATYPKGKPCRLFKDCSGNGVPDIVEMAAGADPCSADPVPNAALYFVLPYEDPPQSKNFDFSTGVTDADIDFMIDTTSSMQPTIDNVKNSLDTVIIPSILNGDPTANPPIPAIPGAYIGINTFRDVPWAPWGDPGDDIYDFFFQINGNTVYGNVSAPVLSGGTYTAPANVEQILGTLTAAGGYDSPEGTTQALWLASTNQAYRLTGGGLWPPNPPTGNYDPSVWGAHCGDPSDIGRACFRPGKLPIFILISDAPFHNGPEAGACPTGNDYVGPSSSIDGNCTQGKQVGGTESYSQVVSALNSISAKVVGVSVNTGTPGAARADMTDLANKTNSLYEENTGFTTVTKPLVTDQDTSTGDVSNQVARLIGLLAGYGLNDVTTRRDNYSCPGNVDCDGDGKPDPAYQNPKDPNTGKPIDATEFIQSVTPVPSTANPKPYQSIDKTTFYGVAGDAHVQFKVTAQNTVLKPTSLVVVQAILHVQTPSGQALGGADGVKMVYFVIPPYIPAVH